MGEAAVELTGKVGPWVLFAPTDDQGLADRVLSFEADGGVVRRLDSAELLTDRALFRAFARELGFPDYFGHNWDALADCLGDLHGDWHGRRDVAVVIERSELLWELPYLPLLVRVLCQAAERANLGLDADGLPGGWLTVAEHFLFRYSDGVDVGELEIAFRHEEHTVVRDGRHLTIE